VKGLKVEVAGEKCGKTRNPVPALRTQGEHDIEYLVLQLASFGIAGSLGSGGCSSLFIDCVRYF
jgi:hypothetical protein